MLMSMKMQRSAVLSRRNAVSVRATSGPPSPIPPPSEPTPVAPTPVALPTPIASKSISITDALAFSGPAPEIVNGRLAMLGIVAAIGAEAASHTSLMTQVDNSAILIGFATSVFMAASFVPILNGSDLQASSGIWTRAAELKNGRLAMMGIVGWLLLEWHAGMPLSNVTWDILVSSHQ